MFLSEFVEYHFSEKLLRKYQQLFPSRIEPKMYQYFADIDKHI